MVIYLLKSGACLAGFYLFYKWFLENESIHNFKRFYLLGAVVLSLVIPLITITTYVEATPQSTPIFMVESAVAQTTVSAEKDYIPFVLFTLYGLGVVLLSIRFVKNLMQLSKKVVSNTKLKKNHTTIVLLKEPVVPHTFLGYIFLEKLKFETGEIPEEVLLHEQVHAKQKHSIDLLFIELVQLLFWFNPLLLLYKRSIKLNHEFLADRVVLRNNANLSAYQNLLLAFSSNVNPPSLANAINYSFIKKRFTVMKKQTSPQAAWLRSLFALPLLAILLYGFSTKETLIKYQETSHQYSNETIKDILIYVDNSKEIFLNGKKTELKNLTSEVDLLNAHLSREQKNKYLTPTILIENADYIKVAEEIAVLLWDIDIYNVSIAHLKSLNNLGLKTPENKFAGRTIAEAEEVYLRERENLKKRQNKNQLEDTTPWSVEISGTAFIKDNANRNDQDKATKEEIKEYNALAKKYNAMSKDKMHIKRDEIIRMSSLYHKMTLEQRKNAEPFPHVEGFPSAPQAPDAPPRVAAPPVPPVPPVPPTPPAPTSVIGLIEDMQNKNAVFIYNSKEISAEEALDIAKSKKINSVSSCVDKDGKYEVVLFSE